MSRHQRLRVYRAEHAVEEHAVPLPTIEHVRALVTVIERLDWVPPEQKGVLVTLSLDNSRAFYAAGTLHLPATASGDQRGSWAWTDLTVVHEYAHHLASGRGHDEVFTHFVLRILDGIGRTKVAAALRASYDNHGVAVYEPLAP